MINPEAVAGAVVFDTWVFNWDRNTNNDNILVSPHGTAGSCYQFHLVDQGCICQLQWTADMLRAQTGNVPVQSLNATFGSHARSRPGLELFLSRLEPLTDEHFTLKNIGHNAANSTQVKTAKLNKFATSTTLPLNVGNLAAGATSATQTLNFPNPGTAGTKVPLALSGAFTGGTFSLSTKVTLP